MNSQVKYIFSGHESFQCRELWLKKGYDFVREKKSFTSPEAVYHLGVGKNMVASIRFWLKAFHIIDNQDTITAFGDLLFHPKTGYDPYLEDEGSLWLLHYQLIKNSFSTTYSLIFNELRREKIEFTKENYLGFIKRKAEGDLFLNINEKTIADDFDVFRKMYIGQTIRGKGIDDSFSGLLTDLNLVKSLGSGKDETFIIENANRNVPCEVFLYSILDNYNYGLSISLHSLESDYNSPGGIFALNKQGLINKISEATERYKWITYADHAGVKELQFKKKEDVINILADYFQK